MPRRPVFDIARLHERLIVPDSYLESGYAIETHPRGVALCSPKVNGLLRERAGRILLEKDPDRFNVFDDAAGIVPRAVKEAAPFLLRETVEWRSVPHNDPKVRLRSDLLLPELETAGAVLHVQETDYFSSLCTNDAALRRVLRGDRVILHELQLLSPDAEEPSDGKVVLSPLRRSPCSNHIGVSTICVTGHGNILLRGQPEEAAQSAGLVAPSGSGSADPADLGEPRYLEDFLVRSMERELREECGISGDIALRTRIIGFARLLHRGGKPEFFGVSTPGGMDDAPGITAHEIGKIRKEGGDTLSFQMHLNLRFLADYVKTGGAPARGGFRA